jgi:hypothetical protein
MKRHTLQIRRFLRTAFVGALALTALAILAPGRAEAGLVVRASIKTPVRATVVVGDAPRVGILPPTLARRTVVRQAPACCRCDDHGRTHVRIKEHRHHRKVWVAGHWEQVSPRTARWIPGHWVRI